MEKESRRENLEEPEKLKRIATFGRKELAKIVSRYVSELWGVEQPPLDKETADRYELGRWAFGHIRRRKEVFKIAKIEVFQTGSGAGDRSVKIFMEPKHSES